MLGQGWAGLGFIPFTDPWISKCYNITFSMEYYQVVGSSGSSGLMTNYPQCAQYVHRFHLLIFSFLISCSPFVTLL